jgi:hypothetical protein
MIQVGFRAGVSVSALAYHRERMGGNVSSECLLGDEVHGTPDALVRSLFSTPSILRFEFKNHSLHIFKKFHDFFSIFNVEHVKYLQFLFSCSF